MSPTMTIKRRAAAASALALLAIVASSIYLRPDAVDNQIYFSGAEEGDDVDYYFRRQLRAAEGGLTMQHGITLRRRDPKRRRRAAGIAGSAVPPTASPESCVLITSQGGVASTAFLVALERAKMSGALCTNDDADADGFKHLPASAYEHDSGGVSAYERRMTINGGPGPRVGEAPRRFHKVIVIVGDPLHTIESTYRRFRLRHLDKLRSGAGTRPYSLRYRLLDVYQEIAATGKDTTGIVDYVAGWRAASLDREHWPDIRVVTAHTLLNNAVDHARWLGVEDGHLHHFTRMSFDPSKQHKTTISVGTPQLAERVTEVFRPAYELVEALDREGVAPLAEG